MHTEPNRSTEARGRWGLLLAALLVGLVGLFVAGWVARDPHRRRRVLHRAGRTWQRVEDAAQDSASRIRFRQRLHDDAQAVLRSLWEAVDDMPLLGATHTIRPVNNQLYAHGAFMGAAPALLDDPRWRRILAFLMPDVYRDVRLAMDRGGATRELIPMFENNPVMAAFGVWRTVQARQRTGHDPNWGPAELVGMEWDVFLLADGVEAWEHAAGARRREVVVQLVDRMVIAHASTTDTVQEQLGLCQWADVRKTPKAQLGGVEPAAWLDLYGRALELVEVGDLDARIRSMAAEPRSDSREPCQVHTFAHPRASAAVVAQHRRLTGRSDLSVMIEIKSQRVTAPLLADLVAELNRRSIHVMAVGSFLLKDLAGMGERAQQVDGRTLPGPQEILFLHFAGDLQHACDRASIPAGTSAMFNGASLLVATENGGSFHYEVDRLVVTDLERYRSRLGLKLGVYVQESDCDAAAASLLSELVHEHPETFALGFAWGGVLDEVALAAGLGDHRGFGSQRVLGQMGAASATWKLSPVR